MHQSLARRGALSLVLLALLSCKDGTGPGNPWRNVDSGQVVTGQVDGARRMTRLRYVPQAFGHLEIEFAADGDSIGLYTFTFAGDTIPLVAPAATTGDTTTRRIVWQVGLQPAATFLLVAARPGGGGSFRLVVRAQDRRPESRAATVQLDEVVEERLDSQVDADVYALEVAERTEVVVQLAYADPATDAVDLRAWIKPLADSARLFINDAAQTMALPADSALAAARAQRLTLEAGRYLLAVGRYYYGRQSTGTPRYRVRVRAVNPGPEERSPLLAGDTVTSAIDYHGDYDEWTVQGTPGDTVVAFVQTLAPETAILLGPPPAGPFDAGVAISTRNTSPLLLRNATGSLVIPSSGTLTLRVQALVDAGLPGTRGPYRLFAYRQDTLPEGQPNVLEPDQVAGGTIAAPGDVDVYTMRFDDPAVVNVVVSRPGTNGTGGLRASLVRAGATTPVAAAQVPDAFLTDQLRRGSGRVTVPAGVYTLRIGGTTSRGDAYLGTYFVNVARIDTLPERHAQAIAIGDTVTGEAIDEPGDLDIFAFTGAASDSIVVRLVMDAPPFAFVATLVDVATGQVVPLVFPFTADGTVRLSLVTPLPRAGSYQIRVGGVSNGSSVADTGGYRLELRRGNAAP